MTFKALFQPKTIPYFCDSVFPQQQTSSQRSRLCHQEGGSSSSSLHTHAALVAVCSTTRDAQATSSSTQTHLSLPHGRKKLHSMNPRCSFSPLLLSKFLLFTAENKRRGGSCRFPPLQFAGFPPAAPVSPRSSHAILLITEAAAPGRSTDREGGSARTSAALPVEHCPAVVCVSQSTGWWRGWGGVVGVAGLGTTILML